LVALCVPTVDFAATAQFTPPGFYFGAVVVASYPELQSIRIDRVKRLPRLNDVWRELRRKCWLQLLAGSFKADLQNNESSSLSGLND
jgi:hypothetical protein